jgi:hypothetical protein
LLRTGRNRKKPYSRSLFYREDVGGPLDLAGETALITHRLIVQLTMAVVTVYASQAFAQGAFPAPLPSQAVQPNDPAFPPENGAATLSSFPANGTAPAPPLQAGLADECRSGFVPLREEAEQRGKLIKAASERHAPPAEACKLIGNFGQAELKMIKYVESHAARCGIPPRISDQLKGGHKNTESMQKIVCAVAQQVQRRGPSGPVGDFWTLPEEQL